MKQLLLCLALLTTFLPADPAWWAARGVKSTDPAAQENNLAPATIGQAKHLAAMALAELEGKLPPNTFQSLQTDLAAIINLTLPDPLPADFHEKQRAVLLSGQLKAISKPFYDHLRAHDSAWLDNAMQQAQLVVMEPGTSTPSPYPWSEATTDDANSSPATLGQLKALFSLALETLPEQPLDTDGDGLPDDWEIAHGLDPNDNGSTDPQNGADGLFQGGPDTNSEAFAKGVQANPNSTLADHDGDGIDNDEDADPDETLIDWVRSPEPSYVVIDLNMEPLDSFPGIHGRIPVDAVLNDSGAVCREPDANLSERTPAVWDGNALPVTWTQLPDFSIQSGINEDFTSDFSVSFTNSGAVYHGHPFDGYNGVPGIQSLTVEWSGPLSAPSLFGEYPENTEVMRLVEGRFDHLAVDETLDGNRTVSSGGFTATTGDPQLSTFNFYSRAPDVTRTGKILLWQSGQLKVNSIPTPSDFVLGLTADPHGKDLITTIPSAFSADVGTKRYRNGAWEEMPMSAVMDMNASGTAITFPDHQLWRNGKTIELDTLLAGTGWSDFKAEQINSEGKILGSAKPDGQSQHKAVLLHPIQINSLDRYVEGRIPLDMLENLGGIEELSIQIASEDGSEVHGSFDGLSEAHIYESDDEITSDAEIAEYSGGNLDRRQYDDDSQDMVFWKENGELVFATTFDTVGKIKVQLVKGEDLVFEIDYTLTAHTEFSELIDSLDEILAEIPFADQPPALLLQQQSALGSQQVQQFGFIKKLFRRNLVTKCAGAVFKKVKKHVVRGVVIATTAAIETVKTNVVFAQGFVLGLWAGVKEDALAVWDGVQVLYSLTTNPVETCASFRRAFNELLGITWEEFKQIPGKLIDQFITDAQAKMAWAGPDNDLNLYAYIAGYSTGYISEKVGLAILTGGASLAANGVAQGANLAAKFVKIIQAVRKLVPDRLLDAAAIAADAVKAANATKTRLFRRMSQFASDKAGVTKLRMHLDNVIKACPS